MFSWDVVMAARSVLYAGESAWHVVRALLQVLVVMTTACCACLVATLYQLHQIRQSDQEKGEAPAVRFAKGVRRAREELSRDTGRGNVCWSS